MLKCIYSPSVLAAIVTRTTKLSPSWMAKVTKDVLYMDGETRSKKN